MRLQLPAAVNMIIDVLQAHGYEGFAVGGCVRDSVLNRTPDDWDITTSATPYQVKELFSKTVDIGLQHGTVTVMVHGVGYEVTTYRIDGEYEDGRHPKEVQFTSNLTEDLKRRDFTINAMAYSKDRGLIDEFGGMNDLQRKIIRCVGDPWQRFGEDALGSFGRYGLQRSLDLRLKKIPKRQLWNWHRRFQRSVRSGSRQNSETIDVGSSGDMEKCV